MELKTIMLNRQVLLALGMIVFVGAVVASSTGAFFSSQAAAVGNTFAAGTLDLKIAQNSNSNTPIGGWLDTQTAAWNLVNLAPGGDIEEDAVWLKNVGSVDGMTLGVALDNAAATVAGTAAQMRITEMTLDGYSLLEGGAGHDFGAYEAPTNCDIEVNFGDNDFTRISDAVDAATPGQTICVGPGNYSNAWESSGSGFPLEITAAGVQLVSTEGPAATTVGGGMKVLANDVVVKGFTIDGSYVEGTHATAIYVSGSDDVEVAFNEFDGAGATGGTSYSIGVYTTGGIEDLSVANNNFYGWGKGLYLNPSVNTVVEYNTFTDVGNGMSNDNPTNGIVRFNSFEDHTGAAVAALVTTGDSLSVVNNNLADDSQGAGISQYGNGTIDAQNNWWGDFDPSDQVNEGTGTVDYSNFAGGPFAGFVNGNDANGNGFADLQDLNNDPILDAGAGLDAGEEKQFVMAVQLDGPTTGNAFQGASLTTDIEFTLNQI